MFCDQCILTLHAGKGGKGCIGFRREKFNAKGGPNGGDGGNGGNVLFKVNTALNTLTHLDRYKQFTADKGEHGLGQNKHGKNAEDLYLEVPLGTIVREVIRNKKGKIIEKNQIADLSQSDKSLLVVKGGRGGYGNAHFVSSIRQAPRFAELGEGGEDIEVELELKLVADIGIIGMPSAGKSTLISVISKAKPKIAAYPFTTLIPNLGVVKISDRETYIVADIPGLIAGAHRGKGLGIKFLKHVQRCRLLVHLLDPSQLVFKSGHLDSIEEKIHNTKAILKNFHLINKELDSFSKDLATKKQIIIINKSDLLTPDQEKELLKALRKDIGRKKRFALYPKTISAATTAGIEELKSYLHQELKNAPENQDKDGGASPFKGSGVKEGHILYRPHLENPKYFAVEKIKKGHFKVSGQRIEQIVNMTDFNNREARMRVYDVLFKMGISKELKKIGAQDSDQIIIGNNEIEFRNQI